MLYDRIRQLDPEIYKYMKLELERQRDGLELIPSENFASMTVMQAMGSILNNKYSEGYPGKRYYGGNLYIDEIEKITIDRAKSMFGVPHANVQPYSGSPANLEVYLALCKPGDTISGMNLTDGGHLTHGWKTSATGQVYRSVPYHVKPDGYIDMEEVARIVKEEKPRLLWVGATAYSREFPFEEFANVVEGTDTYLAADISHISGLVLAGVHKSPSKYVHIITTTTHKTLRGPRAAMIMVTEKGLGKDPELADKIDKAVFPGVQGGPHEHTIAGIGVALHEASTPEFREYGRQVVSNAKALAAELTANGVKLVTGGTDNHMMLIDLTNFGPGLGVFLQDGLESIGITVNKNTIPNEPASPFYPSGVRLGTPAITTRGMKEPEMKEIGRIIAAVVSQIKDTRLPENKADRASYIKKFKEDVKLDSSMQSLRPRVLEICRKFPLYGDSED